MTRTRRLIAALAASALLVLPVAPALADDGPGFHVSSPAAASSAGSGEERLCVGVDDPDGVGDSTTWVCLPEARWYGDLIAFVLSLRG